MRIFEALMLAHVIGVLAMCLGLAIGSTATERHIRTQAIDAGVAEWVTGENGLPEFRYKVPVGIDSDVNPLPKE